jgi:large repetitive protein
VRARRSLTLVSLAVGLIAVAPAVTAARTHTLRFLTDGLNCTGGVCALASGNVGASYGQNIAIEGASSASSLPVFTIVAGSLPPGLSMPSTFGCCGDAIGGTPTQAGTFKFTVEVRDSASHTGTQAFSIAISAPAQLKITFPATCCNAGTVGQSYLQNFFVSGGVGPYTASIATGALPPGLALSAAPPISITGTPTTAGTFTFTIKVTDSRGAHATEQGSITVG